MGPSVVYRQDWSVFVPGTSAIDRLFWDKLASYNGNDGDHDT